MTIGLKTYLDAQWEREVFLDAWWSTDKKSFQFYHKRFRGGGRRMIDALENERTRVFIDIFEVAEELAKRRAR